MGRRKESTEKTEDHEGCKENGMRKWGERGYRGKLNAHHKSMWILHLYYIIYTGSQFVLKPKR